MGLAPNYNLGYAEYTLNIDVTNIPEIGPNDMVISWNCYDNYVRKHEVYDRFAKDEIPHTAERCVNLNVINAYMEKGITVPEENKKFIDIGGIKVYSSYSYGKYMYNAIIKDCKIDGEGLIEGPDAFNRTWFKHIYDHDLITDIHFDSDYEGLWHKLKDLKMNKYNLVFGGQGRMVIRTDPNNGAPLVMHGTGNFALESLVLDGVRQTLGVDADTVNGNFHNYSRCAIGTYYTDKFEFSITKPTNSDEKLYYVNYDDSSDSTLLECMFKGQVGIGPTLNLDWIWNNGGNLLSIGGMFDGCVNLEEISMPNYRPSKITNDNIDWDHIYIDYYKYTFRNCHELKKIENGLYLYDLVGWHYAHISYLTGTFENCYNLKYINFSHVDANANFSGEESPEGSPNEPSKTIFKNCNSLKAIFIGNWDELSSDDRATIIYKFKNLLELSGLYSYMIYIGKRDLTVIH